MSFPHPKDLLDFSGKIVLVTGAGSGLGSAIAVRFAQAGAGVAVHYHTSAGGAAEVVAAIELMGGNARAFQADLTVKEQVTHLFAQGIGAFGRLDVLVNNAGVFPSTPLAEMSEQEWDLVIDANLRSAFLCTQAAAVQMILQGGGGAIVNIASIEALNPAPGHSHYTAAKGGVVMFTKTAALELGREGIRVNAISPGLIWRQGIEEDWPDGVQRYQDRAPLGKLGMPEDVADVCLFLASPAARWVTGANLIVDGGVMVSHIY